MQKIINDLKITNSSFLEFIVLKMLSERTYSALEIFDALKEVGFKTPMGSLYPLLTKFRRQNYVRTGYEDGDTAPVIKTYELTDKGRQRLSNLRSDWKRLNQVIASIGSR